MRVSNTWVVGGARGRFVRFAMPFGNFQIIKIYIDVIVSSPLFKSLRLASEQFLNERTAQTARNDFSITHFLLQ